ncbi:hypothetical protein [Effusibacillus pohliae]|uniref:hypothetical protein n=1 Tax=Effusibacillus pohliae TaxID=232270 RepID=UPI00037EF908|nr:hypothetical protein [Effusibacillus pohliae]
MDVQVRIGGMIVARCTQDATVALGFNWVTNRSNKKENDGVTCISDGWVSAPAWCRSNVDPDLADHPVFQLDNIAIGPF